MDKKQFVENDNELIFLIREHNDEAMEKMVEKYDILILSMINKYHFPVQQKEDYLQEGRLVLLKAIDTYQGINNKTFNKYFELLLQNRFNTLYRKNKKEVELVTLGDKEVMDPTITPINKEVFVNKNALSEFEQEIYEYYFEQKNSIDKICQVLNVEKKTVYNAIQRIKEKVAKMQKNK